MMDEEAVRWIQLMHAITDPAQVNQLTDAVLEYTKNPRSIEIFTNVISNTNDLIVQKGSATYLYRVIENFWTNYDDSLRQNIRNWFINELSQGNLNDQIIHVLLSSIQYIFDNDETNWPDLLTFINNIISSEQTVPLALRLLDAIVIVMNPQLIEQSLQFFLSSSLIGMQCENCELIVLGVNILTAAVAAIKEYPDLTTHMVLLLDIAGRSGSFDEKSFYKFWQLIASIKFLDIIPEDIFNSLLPIMFGFGGNQELQASLRLEPLHAIIPAFISLPMEIITTDLSLCLDIAACSMGEFEELNIDALDHFEASIQFLRHEDILPVIFDLINQGLQSESVFYQSSSLLVFRIILGCAPDYAHKNVESIINFLISALTSDNYLLKKAALSVLSVFSDSFGSLNMYTPKFLSLLIPLFVDQDDNVREYAYMAASGILPSIDTEIDQIFDSYLSLIDQVKDDNIPNYLNVLAYVIELSSDFDDTQCDRVYEILSQILESEDPTSKAPALNVGIAILHRDESQIDYLLELLLPAYTECVQYDNVYVMSEAIEFASALAKFLRENALSVLSTSLPHFYELMNGVKKTKSRIRADAIVATANIARYAGEASAEILQNLVEALSNSLDSGKEILLDAATVAIRRLAPILDPTTSNSFFCMLVKAVQEEVETSYVHDAMYTISKLFKYHSEENHTNYLALLTDLITKIMNCEVSFLNECPFIENQNCVKVFDSFCDIVGRYFQYKTDITDQVCMYLLQWLEKDDQLEQFEATGALTECIQHNTISAELHQQVFNSIMNIINDATDPSLIQNIVFMFNVLIQIDVSMANMVIPVLPIIERWMNEGTENQFGYQDVLANIASLYLQLAMNVPQFPDTHIISALQLFPPADKKETESMFNAIFTIAQNSPSPDVQSQIALAITRFVLLDENKIQDCKLSQGVIDSMYQVFKLIVTAHPEIVPIVKQLGGRTKAKQNKIARLLRH